MKYIKSNSMFNQNFIYHYPRMNSFFFVKSWKEAILLWSFSFISQYFSGFVFFDVFLLFQVLEWYTQVVDGTPGFTASCGASCDSLSTTKSELDALINAGIEPSTDVRQLLHQNIITSVIAGILLKSQDFNFFSKISVVILKNSVLFCSEYKREI